MVDNNVKEVVENDINKGEDEEAVQKVINENVIENVNENEVKVKNVDGVNNRINNENLNVFEHVEVFVKKDVLSNDDEQPSSLVINGKVDVSSVDVEPNVEEDFLLPKVLVLKVKHMDEPL